MQKNVVAHGDYFRIAKCWANILAIICGIFAFFCSILKIFLCFFFLDYLSRTTVNDVLPISTFRNTALERRAKDWKTKFLFLNKVLKFLSQRPRPDLVWRLSALLSSVQREIIAVCIMAVRKTWW